eukprot:1195215-Prorocentrum_minimum.AAC.2
MTRSAQKTTQVCLRVAYTRCCTPEALRAAGVRIVGSEQLGDLVRAWADEFEPKVESEPDARMVLPAGPVKPPRAWHLAVQPSGKKPPAWMVSWERFQVSNITSSYGSSCANNGKDALNTPHRALPGE